MKTLKKILISIVYITAFLGVTIGAHAQTYNVGIYMSYKGPENNTQLWHGGDVWSPRGIPSHFSSLFDMTIKTYPKIRRLLDDSQYGGATAHDKLQQLVKNSAIKQYFSHDIEEKIHDLYENKGGGSPINVRFVLMSQGVAGGFLARYIAGNPSDVGLKSIHYNGQHIANVTSYAVVAVGAPFQGSPLVNASLVNSQDPNARNVSDALNDYESALKTGLKAPHSHHHPFWSKVTGYLIDAAETASNAFLGAEFSAIVNNIQDSPGLEKSALTGGSAVATKYSKNFADQFLNFTGSSGNTKKDGFQSLISMPRVDFNAALALQEAYIDFGQSNPYVAGQLAPGSGSLVQQMNNLPNPDYYRTVIGAEKAPIPYRINAAIRLDDNEENEPALVTTYHKFINAAMSEADDWDHQSHKLFAHHSADRHHRDDWRAAQDALQNIGTTWSTIIGSFEMKQVQVQVPDIDGCTETGPNGNTMIIPGCTPGIKTITVNKRVPLKNDGFMPAKNAIWSSGGTLNDAHNKYYSDTGDGGYNDLELLNYKRTYTQGSNERGDLEKPMKDTHDWLKYTVE